MQQPVQYASFGQRFIAMLIDNVVFIIALSPFFALFFSDPQSQISDEGLQQMILNGQISLSDEELQQMIRNGQISLFDPEYGLFDMREMLIQQGIMLAITIFFWVKFCGTPGKRLLGLKIVDAKTLQPLSPMQSVVRYLGYFIAVMPFCVGLLWILFDEKQQGWHDKLAHSVVIKNQPINLKNTPQQPQDKVIDKRDDDDTFTA